MILYALACDAGHRFDAWFGDSASFDRLAADGLVTCPACGTAHVSKAIMAPAVARSVRASEAGNGGTSEDGSAKRAAPPAKQAMPSEATPRLPEGHRELRAMVRALRSRVLAGTQDVGDRFPAEVRRMHDGDIPHRDIRGEATLDEARSLLDDGIMVLPVPAAPDELN